MLELKIQKGLYEFFNSWRMGLVKSDINLSYGVFETDRSQDSLEGLLIVTGSEEECKLFVEKVKELYEDSTDFLTFEWMKEILEKLNPTKPTTFGTCLGDLLLLTKTKR